MTFSALDSALLGPLFATDAMRAVFADEARVAAMLGTEAALAQAQAEIGLAPEALAPAVAAIAPDTLDLAGLGRKTAVAGVPAIPFVAAVQGRLSAELEPAFHKGATTQDIADTALVLQLRDALDLVAADLGPILESLEGLAATHRDTACVGRSYGQHAAPISFGFKAAIWMLGIAEVAGELPRMRERVLVGSLAGPVGTLSAMGERGPEVGDRFAAALGLRAEPIAWHTRRARMAQLGSWLATLIGALAKMATDVAHLASTEVGEVAEPHGAGRGGSSAMPHKRNPVSSTVILAAHAAAPGLVVTLLNAMAAAHERPVGLWHAEWHALPQLFGLASGALREARVLAEGLLVDPDRMRANLDLTRGLLFAAAAAAGLAPALGRESAHLLVERAAGEVQTSGVPLREVLGRMPEARGAGNLDEAFDLAPALRSAALWTDRALAETARLRATVA